ncbi:MAG: Transcriptional regulator, AraC family [Polaromonas sp.]|nr:Transcriptional regulator, AraC family [Polaromonas sp.]
MRLVTALRQDSVFEIRLQDVHWPHSGQSLMQTGTRWTFDFELANIAQRPAQYTVARQRGIHRSAGRLNFIAPMSTLDLHWTHGHRRSVMCMFDPASLGLPGFNWQEVDPLAAFDIRNQRIEAAMGWLCEELLHPSFASQLHITSMLTLVALETQQRFGASQSVHNSGLGKLSVRQLTAVKALIEQALPKGANLQQLAEACGLPSSQLPARFKNTVGITLRSFVAATHIEKAKLLLSDSRLLIKQVAARSGFESASGFALAFRKATGMRPQQYRQAKGVQLPPGLDDE